MASIPKGSVDILGDNLLITGEPCPLERLREWLLERVGGEDAAPEAAKDVENEPLAADLGTENGKSGAYADVLCNGGVAIDKLRVLWEGEVFDGEPDGLRCRGPCEAAYTLKGLARPALYCVELELADCVPSGSCACNVRSASSSTPLGDGVFRLVAIGVAGSRRPRCVAVPPVLYSVSLPLLFDDVVSSVPAILKAEREEVEATIAELLVELGSMDRRRFSTTGDIGWSSCASLTEVGTR